MLTMPLQNDCVPDEDMAIFRCYRHAQLKCGRPHFEVVASGISLTSRVDFCLPSRLQGPVRGLLGVDLAGPCVMGE